MTLILKGSAAKVFAILRRMAQAERRN